MAFCSKCGQPLAEGTNVCTSCGTPVSDAAQKVQAAPIQSSTEVVNSLPSANSAKFPMFAYCGMAAAVLSLISLFLPKGSITSFDGAIGMIKAYTLISVFIAILDGLAMWKLYDSLKKGLNSHRFPMKGILATNSMFALIVGGLGALLGIITFFALSGSGGYGSFASIGVIGFFGGLCGFAYYILSIIAACKLMSNYEGEVKKIGQLILLVSILAVVMLGAAFLGQVIMYIAGFIVCGSRVFLYLTAKKVIAG